MINWGQALLYLLIFPNFFHYHVFAMYGGARKLLKADPSGTYSPIRDQTFEGSSSQAGTASSSKGFLSKFSLSKTKSQKDLENHWVNTIYQEKVTQSFLMDIQILEEQTEKLNKYSKKMDSVNQLKKQFKKDYIERNNEHLSEDMMGRIKQVMKEMSQLQGENDEELVKIAIYAKALADVTATKKMDPKSITKLEKANLNHIQSLRRSTFVWQPENLKVKHLFESLESLWAKDVHEPSSTPKDFLNRF
ncbi:hypothetical protein PGTUg99_037526 [Puccinia graminis f. sp. tritici]|uniref:Uncharacterized protein n=1 Tax=Puccinia graminis f. sp. tritici TaxID=56615 RepID=A0A5B0SM52_PUCGR|nr:hypothetical protein PGTUg99_037526 [Puccinia graminis f. sp. tritici]